ncbi:TIR domain-containing protein [Fibrella sp. WM1]|uniref:TIR domain-containing protein n=1 Tax=Fibrella musci TaxID=3242485 RepID=UPI00351FF7FE
MKHFTGTLEELKTGVESCDLVGVWQEDQAAGKHCFRGQTGEILNWWPSRGTLQFQGKNSDHFQSLLKENLSGQTHAPKTTQIVEQEKIFIVHGHDREAREQLELILMKLGLDPFVLQNVDSGSRTIVEALEQNIYKGAALGIILMTPDDYGYTKKQTEADRQPRARQNVILEMGMVMASIGRDRMIILKKGALELPTDTAGIQYHEFNDHVREIVPKLVQRLQQLGFEIDPAKIAHASS